MTPQAWKLLSSKLERSFRIFNLRTDRASSPRTGHGYQAEEWVLLGTVHPNPAFLTNRCHTYLAKNVVRVKQQEQDEKEDIEVLLRPLEEIPSLIREKKITHALVLAAFYYFFEEYLRGGNKKALNRSPDPNSR
jgi:hypothetical protein